MNHAASAYSVLAALLLTFGLSVVPAQAGDWDYMIAPYIWGAGLDGSVGVGRVNTTVDAGFGDIVENLDAGILLHFEAAKGDWTVLSDIIFLDLGVGGDRTEVDFKETILELGAGYGLNDSFEVLFGARWIDMDAEIDLFLPAGGLDVQVERSKSWIDPFFGGRWRAQLAERWALQTRADIGGFGVGSDLTWNAVLVAQYAATEKITLGFGYRVMDIDLEDPGFRYDVQMPGALLGVGFSF